MVLRVFHGFFKGFTGGFTGVPGVFEGFQGHFMGFQQSSMGFEGAQGVSGASHERCGILERSRSFQMVSGVLHGVFGVFHDI